MQRYIKIAISYLGSALWWLMQGFWGDPILQWARQIAPGWLLNPVNHMGDIASYAFAYGPPVVLFFLGTYFVVQGWEGRHVLTTGGIEIFPNKSTRQQNIRGNIFDEVGLRFTNKTGRNVRLRHPKLKETSQFHVPSEADRNASDLFCELKFINATGGYVDLERNLRPNESAETGIAVTALPSESFYSYAPGFLRKKLRRPKYFRLKYDVVMGKKSETFVIIK